jgi:hypothetical protein
MMMKMLKINLVQKKVASRRRKRKRRRRYLEKRSGRKK